MVAACEVVSKPSLACAVQIRSSPGASIPRLGVRVLVLLVPLVSAKEDPLLEVQEKVSEVGSPSRSLA